MGVLIVCVCGGGGAEGGGVRLVDGSDVVRGASP